VRTSLACGSGVHSHLNANLGLSIGLYPLPKQRVDLNSIVGQRVLERIAAITASASDSDGLQSLCTTVSKQLLTEFNVPTEQAEAQLQWMVHNYITTQRRPSDRAAISTGSVVHADNEIIEMDVDNIQLMDAIVSKNSNAEPLAAFNLCEYEGWDSVMVSNAMDIKRAGIALEHRKLDIEQQRIAAGLEQQKIAAGLEQQKIAAGLEQQRLEFERRKIDAPLEMRRLDIVDMRSQMNGGNVCGQKRSAPVGDTIMEDPALNTWCNMHCLSLYIWQSRPESCGDDINEVCRRVYKYKLPTGTQHRFRVFPKQWAGSYT
jgi:hypothetical protein